MNIPRVIRILFLVALPLAVCSSGSAASVSGKVADVVDGESFAIVSQNHPLKVKLIAVAAPDKNQTFAGVARQHLSDLILNKMVVVRFSALENGFLVGQVLLGEMDVGAQMIRDGAAWYSKSDDRLLGEAERQIYGASQEAARNEKRGLWQEESSVSPWDYRRAQVAAAYKPAVSLPALAEQPPKPAASRRGSSAGLASEDLMGGVVQAGAIVGQPDIKPLFAAGAPGRWLRYEPPDRHFSILAPSDGVKITYAVLTPEGNTLDIHYVIGHTSTTIYFAMWTKGPNPNTTELAAAADAMKAMLSGINRKAERSGGMAAIATPGRSLKLADYGGRQYALEAGPLTGVVRILSKQFGDEREVFFLCVLNGPGVESSGEEFLNSFRIRPSAVTKQQTANSKQ